MTGGFEMSRENRKSRRAVALRFDQARDEAPVVVAQGQGLIAERMIELAKASGVEVREDASLAEALSRVDIGMTIPEELYPVVAEILVFLNRLDRSNEQNRNRAKG